MKAIEYNVVTLVFVCFIIFFTAFISNAGNINSPPPLQEESRAEQHYWNEIYTNWNNLEFSDTNPDGIIEGTKGDMLLYEESGTIYLEVMTDTGPTWRGIALSDIP